MTTNQEQAIRDLASRYNTDIESLDIVEAPVWLGADWLSVVVNARGSVHDGVEPTAPLLVCGVSPEGNIHS